MSKCPFLSTCNKRVNCFRECPFYEYEELGGICPFKACDRAKKLDSNVFYNDTFRDESIKFLDEIYEEKNFLKLFEG